MNHDLDTFVPLLNALTHDGSLMWSAVSPRQLTEAKVPSAGRMSRMASFRGGTLYLIDHGLEENRVVLAYRLGHQTGIVVDSRRSALDKLLCAAGFEAEPLLKLDTWLRQSLPS